MSTDADDGIEVELERIQSMNVAELRALWRARFNSEWPEAFGPDLLRRSITQKLQEDAYGGLDRKTARLLNQLIAQSARTNGKIVVPRRIKPGAILVREWKGIPANGGLYRDIKVKISTARTGWLGWKDSNS